jgi:hypothetical protein
VAIISVLLSFLGRKIGDIVQAIFGWSVTALFGKLPSKKQLLVTIALVLSIAWPVFVIGLFFPAVAGWALAILPLESWVSPLPLRIAWAVLAVLAPPIVGLLVHVAAPHAKGSALKSMLHGYPLTVGFFLSFVITAVTVPIVKIASVVRGWTDEHVYVQPHEGSYSRVMHELAEATARAGLVPEIREPAKRMMLATTVLRWLAKGAVTPIVAEELLTIRSEGLELILYPSDLLLRGEPKRTARVRAMMTRTEIDADAYLVASAKAQEIQDELSRLRDVIRSHDERGQHAGRRVVSQRLSAIYREMNESELPFDEWVMLEAIARRIERRIAVDGNEEMKERLPLDQVEDGLAKVAAKANRRTDDVEEFVVAPLSTRQWRTES